MDENRENMEQPQPEEPRQDQPTPEGQPAPESGPEQAPGAASGEPAVRPVPTQKDSKSMAMLAHLLGIFTSFIGALIIWLVKKDADPFVDDQGKEALNFQIVVAIATALLTVSVCLAPLAVVVWIVNIVFCIIAAVNANKGVAYRYPLTFRFIK